MDSAASDGGMKDKGTKSNRPTNRGPYMHFNRPLLIHYTICTLLTFIFIFKSK
jgi:hypothetical protein